MLTQCKCRRPQTKFRDTFLSNLDRAPNSDNSDSRCQSPVSMKNMDTPRQQVQISSLLGVSRTHMNGRRRQTKSQRHLERNLYIPRSQVSHICMRLLQTWFHAMLWYNTQCCGTTEQSANITPDLGHLETVS